MPKKSEKVITQDGEELDLDELLKEAGEPKVEKKPESIDWLSLSNKMNFNDYHEMRKKHGLE